MQRLRLCALATFVCAATGVSAHASFHFMQIEQVIGGVNGDTSVQAIQLRMRSSFQNLVANSRIKAFDANGLNPVLIIDMTTNVATTATGTRVLIRSARFAEFCSGTTDFTMTNLIPASYLAAGSLTFEDDFGTIYWRLSWGGASYTGPTTGNVTNDTDGNYGKLTIALPSTTTQAIRFSGAATAPSVTNSSDYALTAGAATFTSSATSNNSCTITVPTCAVASRGDTNNDGSIDGRDVQNFCNCLFGTMSGSACLCADVDGSGSVNASDVQAMVNKLLAA